MRAWPGLVALLVAAGCIGSPDKPPVDFDVEEASIEAAARNVLQLTHAQDGGHFDRSLHRGARNLELVGYSNGIDNTGDPNAIPGAGLYTELAVRDGFVYLSRQSADGTFGGFSIIDATNPAAPVVTGAFAAQGLGDLEVDPEQRFAYAATQRNSPEQLAGALGTNQNPESALPRGIYVVDLADKTHPALDSFIPMPNNGPHTITYVRHPNGSHYVIACTYDLITDPVTSALAGVAPFTQRVYVFLVVPNPAAEAGLPVAKVLLTPVAQAQIAEAPAAPETSGAEPRLVFPHDTRLSIHPFTGQAILEVAYWDRGVQLYDASNLATSGVPGVGAETTPSLPPLDGYTLFAPSAQNNIHLAQSFPEPLVDAAGSPRVVTVAEPEILGALDETGYITFLDTTDPQAITKISHWTLPATDPPLAISGLDFSPHNFDTFDGKVVLAHNHAGLWVIDASTPENLASPRSVAFYMGNVTREASPVYQPHFWGAFEESGLIYASDEATGLHILRYTGP